MRVDPSACEFYSDIDSCPYRGSVPDGKTPLDGSFGTANSDTHATALEADFDVDTAGLQTQSNTSGLV